MENGNIRNWLLNTFAVNNLINESHKLKSRILFEEIPSGREYLTPIIEVAEGHSLFRYYVAPTFDFLQAILAYGENKEYSPTNATAAIVLRTPTAKSNGSSMKHGLSY